MDNVTCVVVKLKTYVARVLSSKGDGNQQQMQQLLQQQQQQQQQQASNMGLQQSTGPKKRARVLMGARGRRNRSITVPAEAFSVVVVAAGVAAELQAV